MKQILIRYEEPITELEAMNYATNLLKHDETRRGVARFNDGTVASYSDTSKNTTITLYKDGREETD